MKLSRLTVTLSLSLALVLSRWTSAQIKLDNEVSPYEPIIASCSCVLPPEPDGDITTEIRVRWAVVSEDESQPATVVLIPQYNDAGEPLPDKCHIWGHPGHHRLMAATTWLRFEFIEVVDSSGNKRKIRNLLAWDSQTYQHRFLIKGAKPPPEDNQPPTANAGEDQSVTIGSLVHLDASGSSDPDGDDIDYLWLLTAPTGSTAILSQADAVQPSFAADKRGTYSATVSVDDGAATDTDTVQITVGGAEAGPRHVIILEETADRTPQLADFQTDLRRWETAEGKAKGHVIWIEDVDTRSTWVPSYEKHRKNSDQGLPCMFIVDRDTQEVLYLGDVPADVEEFVDVLKEHGG